MNNTVWNIQSKNNLEDYQSLNIDNDILNILINRDFNSIDKINNFLYSDIKDISSPFGLEDMKKSVDIILSAINANKKIYIYGDYDVDGITSTSLLYLSLKAIDANIHYYIPIRNEGYGINKNALKTIKEEGGEILITVDCGISSVDEILYANELGLDIIITDHHEINDSLPNAKAIINPKRNENEYKFRYLAGVGTAFMLLLAIYETLGIKEKAYNFLDIVAIGTVADIVPLLKENRIFVKYGLKLLEKTENIGLKTLLNLIYDSNNLSLNSSDIGFKIAPIFNAAGRLDDAKKAVRLICSEDKDEALLIARELYELNKKRKDLDSDILLKVEEDIITRSLEDKSVIVSYDKNFHHGVIGIVASKICDKYYKPTVILELKDDGTAVASARSTESFNFIKAINSMKELFLRYGGHEGAAGFSIKISNLDEFEDRINQYAKENLKADDLLKKINIDEELYSFKVSYDFYKKLEKLEPFGFGNPHPSFLIKNVKLKNIRKIGKNKDHVMFDVESKNSTIRSCAWFGAVHHMDTLLNNSYFDINFKIDISLYQEKHYVKLFVNDVKVSKNTQINKLDFFTKIADTIFPMETICYTKAELEGENFRINIDEKYNEIPISQNRKTVAFINDKTSYLLKILNKHYNKNFNIELIKKESGERHHTLFFKIDMKLLPETVSLNDKTIFGNINNFLRDGLPYNSIQKEILNSLFRKKQNTLFCGDYNRGIEDIVLNSALYFLLSEKKRIQIIGKPKFKKRFSAYADFNDSYQKDYPMTIFLDTIPESDINELCFIYHSKEIILDNFQEIKDSFILENNIEITNNLNLLKYSENGEEVFSDSLPLNKRKDILKNISAYKRIYSNNDILKYL